MFSFCFLGNINLARIGLTVYRYRERLLIFHLKVVDISCGYYHSALVTEEGEVWTWGEGDGGKLGQGAGEDCDTPR